MSLDTGLLQKPTPRSSHKSSRGLAGSPLLAVAELLIDSSSDSTAMSNELFKWCLTTFKALQSTF